MIHQALPLTNRYKIMNKYVLCVALHVKDSSICLECTFFTSGFLELWESPYKNTPFCVILT